MLTITGAATNLSQRGISVKEAPYNAKGDGITFATGATTTAGSTAVTIAGANGSGADVGKTVAIAGAGPGSCANGYITLTNFTSSTNLVTFTVGGGATLATGNMISIPQGGSNIANNSVNALAFYVGNVTGTTCKLYTSYADAMAGSGASLVTLTTSTPTAVCTYGSVAYVGQITAANGTAFTVTPAVSIAVAGVQVTYGSDDTAKFTSAIAALAAQGGGTLYVPPGIYLVDSAPGGYYLPGNAQLAAQSAAIVVNTSNIEIVGAGRGATILMHASHMGACVSIADPTNTVNVSNVVVQDLTATFAVPLAQRQAYQYNAWIPGSIQINALGGTIASYITIRNVETYGDFFGITVAQSAAHILIDGCYVHDGVADGISSYGQTYPTYDVKIVNNTVWNRADDLISIGTVSLSNNNSATNASVSGVGVPSITVGTNHVIANNTLYNGGGGGIMVSGCNDVTIVGNNIRKTLGPGIKIAASANYCDNNRINVSGNVINGAGTGTGTGVAGALFGSNQYQGGIAVKNNTGRANADITITGNTIGPDGANLTNDAYISVFNDQSTTGTGAKKVQIVGNHCVGGLTLLTTNGRNQGGLTGSGIDIHGCANVHVAANYIDTTYLHGVFIDAYSTGMLSVVNNQITTPNTSAGTAYFIDVAATGTALANVTNNALMLNGKTVTANVNIVPAANTNTGNNQI